MGTPHHNPLLLCLLLYRTKALKAAHSHYLKWLFSRSDEQKYEVVNIDEINTEEYDVIIISDYDHGVVHSPQKLIARAKCPVVVDPKGLDWSKYSGAYCIKPNRKEFEEVCGELNVHNVRRAIKVRHPKNSTSNFLRL